MMGVQIIQGDCRDVLKTLEPGSVQTCVTSPPYWNLRDYGVAGQIGLEGSLDDYVSELVGVFREVRRVLRDDGTLWLNLGSSYSSGGRSSYDPALISRTSGLRNAASEVGTNRPPMPQGLKPKDLIPTAWLVGLALQRDGWYLRADCIWNKPNPMPSSVTDRPTLSHEYMLLLSKSERYYYDADAIREPSTSPTTKMPDGWDTGKGGHGAFHRNGREKGAKVDKQWGHGRQHAGFNDRWDAMSKEEQGANGRNKRSVWTVATFPYPEGHFATFPPLLIEPCILAGSRVGDTVLDPFGGSGTTGKVATKHRRHAILIELNPEYCKLIDKRTSRVQQTLPMEDAS